MESMYGHAGSQVMNELWRVISENGFKHLGINLRVYLFQTRLSVGIELADEPDAVMPMQRSKVTLPRYADWRHIGACKPIFPM